MRGCRSLRCKQRYHVWLLPVLHISVDGRARFSACGRSSPSGHYHSSRLCGDGVVQAKVQPRLIESGMASTALVTHVVVSKFAWYLPLYRQVQILAGQGIHLDRATLAGWVKRAAWWLKSLYELQLRTIQASPRLFCDETPMPVLDPGRHRTRTCQFWAHAIDDRPWGGPSPPAAMPPTRRSHAVMAARSDWLFVSRMRDANSSRCTRRCSRHSLAR
jgi:Transposase IS66 family